MDHPVSAALKSWLWAPRHAGPLALGRWTLGLGVLVYYLNWAPTVAWYLGEGGLLQATLGLPPWCSFVYGHVHLLLALTLIAALCFTIGCLTRAAGLILTACLVVFAQAGGDHTGGWWTVVPWFTLYLSLADSGRLLSVEAWWARRQGRPLSTLVPVWPLRLLQLHLAAIYIGAAWPRWDSLGWRRGEVVYQILANASYSRFPLMDLQPLRPLLRVLTWASELLELVGPLLLWIPLLQRLGIPALIAFHFGLMVFSLTDGWQPMVMAGLLALTAPDLLRRTWTVSGPAALPARAWAWPLLPVGLALLLPLLAIPKELVPRPLGPTHYRLNGILSRNHLGPHHGVFSGVDGKTKNRYWGLRVIVQDGLQGDVVVFESTPGLNLPAVHLLPRPEFTISERLLAGPNMASLKRKTTLEGRRELVRRTRYSGSTQKLGRFFCQSPHYAHLTDRRAVSIVGWWSNQNYKTGRHRAYTDVLYAGSCPDGRSIADPQVPEFRPKWRGIRTWRIASAPEP